MSKLNVEQVKAESQGLRGPLPDDLESADAFLSEAGKVLIKFHGSYEQTNRDKRGAAAKEYIFMVRSKLPGGRLTPAQYLAHDDIATRHGNGTLRITTRQGIQFHGVVKGHLRDTIRDLNHALVTTFGACGDVVRNVMCCPAPSDDPQRQAVQRVADRSAPRPCRRRRPTTRSGSTAKPSSPTRRIRSTARPTCRASSRSPSPSPATTAWTSSPTTPA